MYTDAEVSELRFGKVRMELDRLASVPCYSVPEDYVATLIVRAAESASDETELASAVRRARGQLGQQCPAAALRQFWSTVRAKPFTPSTVVPQFI